jgi:FdhD protein
MMYKVERPGHCGIQQAAVPEQSLEDIFMAKIQVYRDGVLVPETGYLPREFPLKLTVNGREIATLVASPHDLRSLVAGFLRLQGFVENLDDFIELNVCEDFGVAEVRVRKELPERLRPILTSGCGTGVTFTLPAASAEPVAGAVPGSGSFTPTMLFTAMEELSRHAENYRRHGGIHSAAVADGATLLLYAEDIGRHNTIDRLAGEALFRGIDLAGKALLTSGRVSSEMAAKAAHLNVPLIASRTSPTDMAVTIAAAAGITLIGYVRGGKFNVYSHPERLDCPLSA